MFRSDQPIQSSKEDILGRDLFAKSLANGILRYDQKDSLSIGLFGPWGSGKTSIVNMALEEIQKHDQKKQKRRAPIIVKFNPWYFSDQNQLIAQFFKELSAAVNRIDKSKKHIKIGQALQTYAGFFEPLRHFPVVAMVGNVARAIKAVGAVTERAGQDQSEDLWDVKAGLSQLLESLDRKILIVIDDIDRLNSSEIRQIFQLVKSLADFPHTIYLLSFDKDVVINALGKVQEGSGMAYLEKVVQVPFEIPQISQDEVARLLFSMLDEIIKNVPEEKWDQTHWGNIYHSGLKHFFNDIRDVNRYINTLRFGFEMIKDDLNPVDFIAINAIQVFLPELYYAIRDNKDLFAGIADSSYYGESEKAKARKKAFLEAILGKVTELSSETLMDFLERLFPKLQNVGHAYSFLEAWRKNGNIASPDMFDAYFRLSLPKGELSQSEIKIALAAGRDSALFAEGLLKLKEEGKILRFLERMEDYTHKDIPEEHIQPIITALMDVGDMFPEGPKGFFETETPMKILRIFYQLSHRFDDQKKRFEIFKEAITQAKRSLYPIVDEVAVQCQQHGKYGLKNNPEPEEKRTVSLDQLKELENLACNRIKQWAKAKKLSQHRYLVSILFMWDHWGGKKDIDRFIHDTIRSDTGLVNFITSFLNQSSSHGMSDYVSRMNWRMELKSIDHFVSTKVIELRIRKLSLSPQYNDLEDKQKIAIKTFLDAYDGKVDDLF